MQRLIPGKTKVSIELFKGISVGDIAVGGGAMGLLIVVLISNLPWKLGICIGIVAVAAFLLVRLDEQPNYMFFLHILRFLGYDHRFGRSLSDKMLIERGEGRMEEAAFDEIFSQKRKETPKERKERKKALAAAEKERKKERKKEDKLLKSKKTPEDVKQKILEKRAQEEEEEAAERARESERELDESTLSKSERKALEKIREKERREKIKALEKEREKENKLLKSKKTPEDVKQQILDKRTKEAERARETGEEIVLTKAERKEQEKARKAAEKAREKEHKKEDKLLKSKKTPEDVKQQIREKRVKEAERELEEGFARSAEAGRAAADETPKERKRREKEREKKRKEEDKLLKSSKVSDEEKEAIRARRRAESEEAMRKMAEAKEAQTTRRRMEGIIPFTGIKDGYIEYLNKSYYGAVLEIDPVEFRFFSEHRRDNSIENCLGRILRSLHAGYSANIVKLERPIMYDRYLDREYAKLDDLRGSFENGVLSEEELKARVEIEYDRINELRGYCDDNKVISPAYYLCLFESDKHQLEMQMRDAEDLLKNGELTVHRLDDKGLAVFLKYTNQIDFDERDVEKLAPEDLHIWAQPDIVDFRARRVEINHIITHNFRVVNYPTVVGDAWIAGVMSIPGTKVVIKCRPMDRGKAIRNIDHSLQELRGQWSATGVDSKRMEIETHLSTLQDLLSTLQSDSESLLECNIYITAYDIVSTRKNLRIPQPPESELPRINEMKKIIRRSWQESGFRLNNMEFDQVQAFIGSQVSALDPLAKEGRGISSNTVAAAYPWIYAHISDEGGVKLGESDGIPIFINFFRRDSERVNSNMVIVGKSGSGKSYATKSLLANLAAEDAKIFILDPENEYTELAHNLHGQIINVGNAQYGRLNPFHIITALDDDEAGEGGPSGSYATHLQFLEEFFRQIMPDCEKDAMEYLNTMIDRMYLDRDITGETDLSKLAPEDYPIFDDLYDQVLQEYQSSDNEFTRDMLRAIMNYVAKFSTGGRNANIWNGPSTVTTDENFTVFNFQSMLANRNQTVANAQMLLVLKYIDNEIIKNRDYNRKYHAQRKVVIVIDEAHVFIDAKYPIALDFMFQLAKRIRKYNGMQIVITQNIKDFVGTEELARKSTAIINACQYSFIFALAPNDMSDLVKLYEKAGGINESEQEQIVQAPRGQAFAIMSPTSRSSFRVETASGITEMFEDMDYQTRYFSGVKGAENWEDYIGDSRAVRSEITGEAETDEEAAAEENVGRRHISIRVFEKDEYENAAAEPERETEPEAGEEPEEETTVRRQPAPAVQETVDSRALDMIATALDKISDSLTTGGAPIIAPAYTPMPMPVPMPAFDAESEGGAALLAAQAQLREMNERMRRMEEERNELLRRLNEQSAQEIPEYAAEPEEEPEQEPAEEPEEAFAAETGEEAAELYTGTEEQTERSIYDGLDAEEFSEEEDGELVDLFSDDIDDDDFIDEEADNDLLLDDEEGYTDEERSERERLEELFVDEDDFIDEDEDPNGEAEKIMRDLMNEELGTDESTGESEEEPLDFMASFCSFAESMKNMTAFDKMRANGKDVVPVTLADLAAEAKAQAERRRLARENAS